MHGRGGRGHALAGGQRGLHLTQLDAEPAHLHLLIGPPEVLERAVVALPPEVTRAVEASAGHTRERVGHEPLRREPGMAEVPDRDPTAADDDLPVDHVHRRLRQRAPDLGGAPVGTSGSDTVAHTVVSVGPYALSMRRPGAHLQTSSAGHGSPATTSVRRSGKSTGGMVASADGTIVATVMRSSRRTPAKPPAESTRSTGTTRSVAPAANAVSTSDAAASKLNDASWSTRLLASMANVSICATTRSASERWLMATPFGRPVDPDV